MHVLPTLVWSSRESIRAQLVSVLHTLPTEDGAPRFQALELLAIFGGPEQLPLFREVLLDVREHDSVRSRALKAGLRHGLSALLNAHVRNVPSDDIRAHLRYHLARQEGRDVEDVPRPMGRRYVAKFITSRLSPYRQGQREVE